MRANDNYNCLPFYTTIEQQNHRKPYSYGDIYALYCPNDRLLSFQIDRPHLASSDWSITLVSMTDGTGTDITSQITAQNGWTVIENYYTDNNGGKHDKIIYCPISSMPTQRTSEGRYYIILQDGMNTWYSEVITVVTDISPYLKLQWRDLTDQPIYEGAIIYKGLGFNYTNTLYFATQLGKPEYPFDEEGENRGGYFFAEKQVSSKTYKAVITAPEYLCDCLRLVRMADLASVTDGNGTTYNCDTFHATPQWGEQGNIAEVVMEFTTGTVVKHIGHGWTRTGDYDSQDFNEDYN